MRPTLNKPAATIYRHNLVSILESCLAEESESVRSRIDVRLLEPSINDKGWEVFVLEYHVSAPINTIITPACMQQYLAMFTFLWKLKRLEHHLNQNIVNEPSLLNTK